MSRLRLQLTDRVVERNLYLIIYEWEAQTKENWKEEERACLALCTWKQLALSHVAHSLLDVRGKNKVIWRAASCSHTHPAVRGEINSAMQIQKY
jgi:hypothetical protein